MTSIARPNRRARFGYCMNRSSWLPRHAAPASGPGDSPLSRAGLRLGPRTLYGPPSYGYGPGPYPAYAGPGYSYGPGPYPAYGAPGYGYGPGPYSDTVIVNPVTGGGAEPNPAAINGAGRLSGGTDKTTKTAAASRALSNILPTAF
jgi:hypothetical protein